MIKRRNFLKVIPVGLIGATTFSFSHSSVLAAIAKKDPTQWDYEGNNGLEDWGDISEEYKACKLGQDQSPIDLHNAITANLSPLKIVYHDIPLQILNNGHTIQINSNQGNYIIIEGKTFELIQFHFHHPSEHTVNRKSYPMEVHFVHKSKDGQLAVLGVFLKEGQENMALKPIWDVMPTEKTAVQEIAEVKISLVQLLPTNLKYNSYYGSLTTPPCTEIVRWQVFLEPLEVSFAQIAKFAQIFPINARSIQPLNHRFLLESNSF